MLGHMMLANVAGSEMMCSEQEAMRIAVAWVGFRKQYGGFGFDPKHQAIAGLALAVVSVEFPKLRMRMARKRAEANADRVEQAARDMAPGGTVVQLPTGGAGGPIQPGNGFPLHG